MRPDLRSSLRQDGERGLDGGDHPRRDPATPSNGRGSERQSHPLWHWTHHQRGRRNQPHHRLQRAGPSRPPPTRRPRERRHNSAREFLGHELESRHPDRLGQGARRAFRAVVSDNRGSDGAAVPHHRRESAQGKEHVCLRVAGVHLRPQPRANRRADRVRVPQEIRRGLPEKRRALAAGSRMGRSQPRFQDRSSNSSSDRSPRRDERQRSAWHGCASVGNGALRDVSHHAGHFGVSLSGGGLFEVWGNPSSGGG